MPILKIGMTKVSTNIAPKTGYTFAELMGCNNAGAKKNNTTINRVESISGWKMYEIKFANPLCTTFLFLAWLPEY